MLNHITIAGRLTREPEYRVTNSGSGVANFTIACDRDFADKATGKRDTDFIDCIAWGHSAEFVTKYLHKGNMVAVSGRLQIRTWKDKEGNTRKATEINSDNVYAVGSKQDSTGDFTPPTNAPAFEKLEDDDAQLPF